jgi:aldose 1-epimerase
MQTVGLFKNSSFDDHWVSRTDTQVTVQMNARTMELVVRTKNTGDEPEPMGIGWHPRFEVTKGSRERVQLRLPDGELMEVGEHGKPSGRLVEGSGAVGRLDVRPTELGPMSVDATLVNAKTSAGDSGPALEMRDPAAGYGLRMTAESAAIKALRVTSPADSGYVSLGMQTNLDDPMGKEWVSPDGSDRSGLVTLQPGEVLEWKVKLEIFPVGRP